MDKIYSATRRLLVTHSVGEISLNAIALAAGMDYSNMARKLPDGGKDALIRAIIDKYPVDIRLAARGIQAGLLPEDERILKAYPYLCDPFFNGVRGKIHLAALTLIRKYGKEGVTRRMLAREAGVGLTSVTHHGGHTKDILSRVMAHAQTVEYLKDIKSA